VFGLVGDAHLDGVSDGVEVFTVTPEVLRRLAGTEHPRGPVAVLAIPKARPLETGNTVVMVGIADPGNAGTIVRSAAAFGFQVAVAEGSVDLWAPKVLRAAAGAHFLTRIGAVDEDPIGNLAAAGVFSAALVVAGGRPPGEVTERPIGILVGSEAHGLDAALARAADDRITLPMPGGTESLNAAIAASIAMYELAAPI
jgi:TrmH family RNA methyltransferase